MNLIYLTIVTCLILTLAIILKMWWDFYKFRKEQREFLEKLERDKKDKRG